MEYPTLPFAIVNLLAAENPERLKQSDKRMVLIGRHDNETVNFSKYELAKDEASGAFHWDPIMAGMAQLHAAGRSDSLLIAYPQELGVGNEGDPKMDAVAIVRPHEEVQVLEWQWSPIFNLYHVSYESERWKTISKGAGIEMMQNMINKEHPTDT